MKNWIIRLLVFLGIFAGSTQFAFAGTDLSITCPSIGTCAISPSGTPLFDEAGWYPGATVTQRFSITNSAGQTGFAGIEVDNYTDTNNLGEVVTIEIREGSPVGPIIYGGVTMHQFRDDGYFTIDTLSSGQTVDYYLTATMPVSAGNEYQGSMLRFDLNAGLEIAPIPPPSGAGDGTGTVLGTSTAAPPVCSAQAPTAAPSVTIVSTGTNTTTLSWSPVSPVTHYALVFTRTSDGAQYGSPNVGNVTTYTITNLSGGASYTFEIFGVNDCAPGSRGTAVTGIVPGPVLAGRPLGPGGEVLGVQTSPTPSPVTSPSPLTLGEVAGATTQCRDYRMYLPLILLVLQALFLLLIEYIRRQDKSIFKLVLVVAITLLSIALFYWLRECNCFAATFWGWLCKWYWIVALLLTGVIRLFGYAFLEEAEEKAR